MQVNILPLSSVISLQVIYLPKQIGLPNVCICYEQPQCSGEKLNQFRFACPTDYEHFQADERQMLTKTKRDSIPPVYSW